MVYNPLSVSVNYLFIDPKTPSSNPPLHFGNEIEPPVCLRRCGRIRSGITSQECKEDICIPMYVTD
jgi:hypothetical protein